MSVVGPIVAMFVVFLCSGGWCLTINVCGRAHHGPVCGFLCSGGGPMVVMFVVFLCSGGWCLTSNACGRAHGGHVCGFVVFRRWVPDYQCLWSCPSWSQTLIVRHQPPEHKKTTNMATMGPTTDIDCQCWCLTINVCGRAHRGPVCGFLVFRRLVPDIQSCGWAHRGPVCGFLVFRRLMPDYQCLWSCPSWSCLWFCRVQEMGAWLSMSVVVPILVMFVVFSCSGGWCLTINVYGRAHPGHVCGFVVFRRWVPDYQCLWSCPSWSCL